MRQPLRDRVGQRSKQVPAGATSGVGKQQRTIITAAQLAYCQSQGTSAALQAQSWPASTAAATAIAQPVNGFACAGPRFSSGNLPHMAMPPTLDPKCLKGHGRSPPCSCLLGPGRRVKKITYKPFSSEAFAQGLASSVLLSVLLSPIPSRTGSPHATRRSRHAGRGLCAAPPVAGHAPHSADGGQRERPKDLLHQRSQQGLGLSCCGEAG